MKTHWMENGLTFKNISVYTEKEKIISLKQATQEVTEKNEN